MTSFLDRMGDSMARFLDRTVLEQRASGYALNIPEYRLDKPSWPDGNIGTYRKAFASQTAVYSCVLARARAVSAAPVRVYREADGDRVEEPTHPLRLLMQRPNPEMSEAEFMVMTQTLMDVTGFAAINKVRSSSGAVVQLWHLRSDWLREIRRNQRASDWEFRVPGRDAVIIRAENVLIVPGGPSTDLGTIGMSPIAVALREIGIDAGLTDFLKLFIEAGGTPRYALVTPNAVRSQEEAEELRSKFGYIYGGFQNWTKTVLLHGGLDYKTIGSNIEEFAYPQLRALTETHICSIFGVPPIIAGVQSGIDASTYSNYAQARKAFFEDTVHSLWARLDGALTRGLLSEFEDDRAISLEFDTSAVPALQEDQTQLWTRTTAGLSAGGLTLNQFQNAVGLPGFGPAGEVLYLPFSAQPTKPDDLVMMADEAMKPPEVVPTALTAGDAATDDETVPPADETPARALQPTEVRLLTLPLETRARIVTANRRNVSRLTAKFQPRLRAMFRRQGEIVAAAYSKRADGEHETRALEAVNWDDLNAEMERELRGLYDAAGKLSFDAASGQLGTTIAWDLANPKIRQTVEQLARRIVGINQTTRADVAKVVTDGLSEGLTTPQIAEKLQGLYAETYRGRSMTIARTESMTSYNLSTATAYQESGIVQAMVLMDNINHVGDYGALDGLSCAQRDGVITDVDKVDIHIYSEHPNGTLAVSPLLVRPLGAA